MKNISKNIFNLIALFFFITFKADTKVNLIEKFQELKKDIKVAKYQTGFMDFPSVERYLNNNFRDGKLKSKAWNCKFSASPERCYSSFIEEIEIIDIFLKELPKTIINLKKNFQDAQNILNEIFSSGIAITKNFKIKIDNVQNYINVNYFENAISKDLKERLSLCRNLKQLNDIYTDKVKKLDSMMKDITTNKAKATKVTSERLVTDVEKDLTDLLTQVRDDIQLVKAKGGFDKWPAIDYYMDQNYSTAKFNAKLFLCETDNQPINCYAKIKKDLDSTDEFVKSMSKNIKTLKDYFDETLKELYKIKSDKKVISKSLEKLIKNAENYINENYINNNITKKLRGNLKIELISCKKDSDINKITKAVQDKLNSMLAEINKLYELDKEIAKKRQQEKRESAMKKIKK